MKGMILGKRNIEKDEDERILKKEDLIKKRFRKKGSDIEER